MGCGDGGGAACVGLLGVVASIGWGAVMVVLGTCVVGRQGR